MKSGMDCLKLAAAIFMAAATATAMAQGRGGGGGGGFGGGFAFGGGVLNGPTILLGVDQVQKELTLGEEQKTKVTQLVDDNRNAIMNSFQLSPEERQTKMQELTKENNKKIADILSAPQNERLDQISLQLSVQAQGPGAFIRPEVADKLGLTSEQKDKIQAIVDELGGKRRDLIQNANGYFPAAVEQMTKLAAEEKDKAVALLTDDQKKKWETLAGKEFKIDLTQMRAGFGAGFGGRGGGGGFGGGGQQN